MTERLLLSPEIIDLSETNNIYMTLKMVICTTNTNLNGTKFTEDFIDGVVANQEKFIGTALVVNREKLENEQYDDLTHEFKDGTLGTDMIGSFVSFEKSDNVDGSKSLVGEARVLKRFPKTCAAISELYQSNSLLFSCEVLVKKYDNVEDNYREVNYHGGLNNLIGNTVVTNPAEVDAKPMLLVASLDEDIQNQIDTKLDLNGGAKMALSLAEKRKMMNEFGSKLARKMMAKVRAEQILDVAELASIEDGIVESMIGLMGEEFSANSYCGFWTGESLVFDDYFVLSDYYNDKMFMFDYSINEEEVFSVSNPRKCKFEIVEVAELALSELNKKVIELFNVNESLKKDLETKETELSSLQTSKLEVETELSTIKDQIAIKDEALETSQTQANEKIIQLGEVVEGLKDKLKQVEPIVEQYNQVQSELAEKAKVEKQKELTQYALNSKMIEEKELVDNEEIKLAIAELNEVKIKEIVADRIVKNNIELSQIQKQENDDIVVNVSETKDLITPSVADKYGL